MTTQSQTIEIIEATPKHADSVADLVLALLVELEPHARETLSQQGLPATTRTLLSDGQIIALLAFDKHTPIGVLTLHACAAIYAGGVFGEISELYVAPAYRSQALGQQLIDAAMAKARVLGWKRLEVGSPPADAWPRSVRFYESNGFRASGTRLARHIV